MIAALKIEYLDVASGDEAPRLFSGMRVVPATIEVDRPSRPLRIVVTELHREVLGSVPATRVEYLQLLEADGRVWPAPRPLKVEVEETDDGVCVLAPLLGLGGAGVDFATAVADLADSAWRVWQEFRDAPPESLHASAVNMRDRLSHMFQE